MEKMGFRVRRLDFSLEYRAIRPSAVFRTRRETALRGEAYARVPDLRSLDKLRDVGDSPYVSFTLCLSVFTIFELIEAVSGSLIGPKTWDRNVRIFLALSMQSVGVRGCLGILGDVLCYK